MSDAPFGCTIKQWNRVCDLIKQPDGSYNVDKVPLWMMQEAIRQAKRDMKE